MADLALNIANDIQEALSNDSLDLPSLPEVALEIREEAESDLVSPTSLAKVVSKDPGLSAQLIKIANSPMFRATRAIEDLSQAISHLGVEYAANMVTGLAMQHMFQATSDMVEIKFRQVWKASTGIAAWSSVISQRYTKLRPDLATLAGLTHKIGVLPILSWVQEHHHLVRDSMTLDKLIDSGHPTIGTMILKEWKFSEEIISVPQKYQSLNHQADHSD